MFIHAEVSGPSFYHCLEEFFFSWFQRSKLFAYQISQFLTHCLIPLKKSLFDSKSVTTKKKA